MQPTPLHVASRKGYVKTVECLVKLGADLSIRDSNGVSMCNDTTEGRKLLLTERCGSLYISYKVHLLHVTRATSVFLANLLQIMWGEIYEYS